MRTPLYEKAMQTASISLPLEHKQLLQIIGKGMISAGIRILIERLAPKELEELNVQKAYLRKRIQTTKGLHTKASRSTLESVEAVPEKGRGVLRKKKRERAAG